MNASEPADVLTLGSERRWTRGRFVLVLALVAVLGISGYRMLTSGRASDEAVAESRTGPPGGAPGVRASLPQRSPVVYAVGRTVHAGNEELSVHGPEVVAGAVVRVRGPAGSGWLVTLEQPGGGAGSHGSVDATGRFHRWPVTAFVGSGTALLSPDGSEVLAVKGGRTRVLSVTSGSPRATVPPGRAVAWGEKGVYLLRGGRSTARVGDPGLGMVGSAFDAQTCETPSAIKAAVVAGWDSCRRPGLVAATADGGRLFTAAPLSGGVRLTAPTGVPLLPRLHDGPPGRQRLAGAAFLDEERVVLSLTERTDRGAVSVFVTCTLATGTCEQVSDPVAADDGPGAAFLVAPPCEDAAGRRPQA
jgi:hypothetical protein